MWRRYSSMLWAYTIMDVSMIWCMIYVFVLICMYLCLLFFYFRHVFYMQLNMGLKKSWSQMANTFYKTDDCWRQQQLRSVLNSQYQVIPCFISAQRMSKGHWLSLLALLLKVALSYRHPKRTYPWFRFAYNYEQGVDSTSYEDFTADMPNRPFTFTELNMYPDSKEALFWNISYRFRLLLERESESEFAGCDQFTNRRY